MSSFSGRCLPATLLILSAPSSGAANLVGQAVDQSVVREHASMVFHYPHDEHVFGELPPDLTPVTGASAQLERGTDEIDAVLTTRITPGHVGKLLAVVVNNPAACRVATPVSACGPHEEEFNREADGGFYLGTGEVADADGRITLNITARVNDTSNVLCGGAANPDFDACALGFALNNPSGAEVTLVVLDNGPAAQDPGALATQLAAASPCATCAPFTVQVASGFGREPRSRP